MIKESFPGSTNIIGVLAVQSLNDAYILKGGGLVNSSPISRPMNSTIERSRVSCLSALITHSFYKELSEPTGPGK